MFAHAGQESLALHRPPAPPHSRGAQSADRVQGAESAHLDPLELESLTINLDAALRVHARHQFFSWTQGALQSMVGHELLICAVRNARPGSLQVDSFSTAPVDATHFNELFRQDVSFVPRIVKRWEENRCQAVACDVECESQSAGGALARELIRMGATRILAHGTHDVAGRMASFFTFASRPGAIGPRQAYFAALLVPSLHSAWVRAQVDWQAGAGAAEAASIELLTSREREVLEWIYRGKSNIEIGMILEISPLTVKNHVQKILRKLDVLNRTQAVGKALARRILNT